MKFLKKYFEDYPVRTMLELKINHEVKFNFGDKWIFGKVTKLDASLAKCLFKIDQKTKYEDWIYRGSERLYSMHKKVTMKHENMILSNVKEINNSLYINNDPVQIQQKPNESTCLPTSIDKPQEDTNHSCSQFCMETIIYNNTLIKNLSALSVPLKFGFIRSEEEKIKYTAPCGRVLYNQDEVYTFFKMTRFFKIPIEFFCFDTQIKCEMSSITKKCKIYLDDISGGKEFKPISAVNDVNNSMPQTFKYITEMKFMHNDILDLDTNFLCGCDCVDNCDDKSKCACWQLTLENTKKYPQFFSNENIGYHYRKLDERVFTGIYECNSTCRCSMTCLNRVVQQPLSVMLQIFYSTEKGWGVKTLSSIPKGTFVCKYVGEIFKEDSELSSIYTANLDFVCKVQDAKEDFESDALTEDDYETPEEEKESSNDEYQPPSKKYLSQIQETSKSLRVMRSHKKSLIPCSRHYFKDFIYVCDSKNYGNIGRYINHSCDPNLFVQNVFIDIQDVRFPQPAFFAIENIENGTELSWDYNYSLGDIEDAIACACGSQICRGRLC